jgi:hypothetical protein
MEETIKKEEAAQESEIMPVQGAPTHKKLGVGKLIREMWPAYLIEIFVIILGISITLALEAWREDVKDDRLEQIYLKNLRSDVETDQGSLKYTIDKTEKLLDKGNELLAQIRNQQLKTFPADKLKEDLRAILERPDFISRDASFSDLKSSGNMHLLKDIRLKNLLFAYYAETQHIRELQNAELQATINLSGNYFLKLFALDDKIVQGNIVSADALPGLLNSVEFDNQVLLRVSNRKELLTVYQNAEKLCNEVKEELTHGIE